MKVLIDSLFHFVYDHAPHLICKQFRNVYMDHVDLYEVQQRYYAHAVTVSEVYLIPLQTSVCCYQVIPYFIAFFYSCLENCYANDDFNHCLVILCY
jgi:hypothetical protein